MGRFITQQQGACQRSRHESLTTTPAECPFELLTGTHGGGWPMGGSIAELRRRRQLAAKQNRYALHVRRFNPDHDYPEVQHAPGICTAEPTVTRPIQHGGWLGCA